MVLLKLFFPWIAATLAAAVLAQTLQVGVPAATLFGLIGGAGGLLLGAWWAAQ